MMGQNRYLGPDGRVTWYQENNAPQACEELVEYILSHGNFGRKDNRTNAVKVVRKWGSLWDGLRCCGVLGCRENMYVYPAFQKHRI